MRVHSFTFTLAAFGFFQSVHCLSNLHDNVVTLSPINTKLYENAVGLQARATKEQDFSELDPKDQARLIYGHPGGTLFPASGDCKLLTCYRKWADLSG